MKKWMIILAVVSIVNGMAYAYEYSDYTWFEYNGHQYAVTKHYANWLDAEAEAVAVGGHLVTINSTEENAWLCETFSDLYREGWEGLDYEALVWTGLRIENDEWSWVSGEISIHPLPWYTGAPIDLSQNGMPYAYLHIFPHWAPGTLYNHYYYVPSERMYGIIEIAEPVCGFSEDFTIDPEWTTTEPDNVKWDPAGFYRAKVTDNPSGWAQWGYCPVFQEVSDVSFTLEFDINPVAPSYGTYPLLSLIQEGIANPYTDKSIFVAVMKADEFPKNFVLNGKAYGGSSLIYFSSPELQAGEWYRQRIDYDAESKTLIWEILDSTSGLFHNGTYTDISIAPFNQVAVGYQGITPVYGTGWAEIYVDNIDIVCEPEPECGWIEQDKLHASDPAAGDSFGYSVAISDFTAIVGAYGTDDTGSNSGAVYLFNASTGAQLSKLIPLDPGSDDWFGWRVGISGNTAIVGAHGNNDAGNDSGSAYLFDINDPCNPIQIHKLTASDAAAEDEFGESVAISGNIAVVGAYGDDDTGSNSGSAYLYDFSDPCNITETKLTASDGAPGDYFTYHIVAISGATALVGAFGNDDAGSNSGSAYMYDFSDPCNIIETKLTASDAAAEDRFGYSVAISGTTALVGAYHYDDDTSSRSGSAYLYDFSDPCNIIETKLTASDAAPGDGFGVFVAISGATAFRGVG